MGAQKRTSNTQQGISNKEGKSEQVKLSFTWLLVIPCSLLDIRFSLFAFCFLLFAFCFLLFAFCFLLLASCFLLIANRFVPYALQSHSFVP
ncbi:MAG: hypothetical protein FVQ82_14375 [Planctomycetes bacterium]|nr:hypothetical protein [Planctomycetota bacterium]